MRDKVATRQTRLSPPARARVLRQLKKGDQARVAEIVQATPDYVKKVLRYRPGAKSPLANRIWITADRIIKERAQLANDLKG